MRIVWEVDGSEHSAALPYADSRYVEVSGASCPDCGQSPAEIYSPESRIVGHDSYRGAAYCAACKSKVGGELVVTVSTLLGVAEDERVLGGSARVF